MGFFSWKTSDDKETIANVHSGHENAGKPVYLLQPKGKPNIEEPAYNGYGVFGNIDAYAWLAKQNLDVEHLDIEDDVNELRQLGIDLYFKNKRAIKFPLKFSFDKNAVYENLAAANDCEKQGYFYDLY